jgi:cytoskeletal protein CcmA (bactofilin family)
MAWILKGEIMARKQRSSRIKLTTILGNETEFQGNLQAKGSARVDGSINGNVKVSGSLVIGACGYVNGDIEAESAIIGGEVLGNIKTTERVELTSSAKVIGDINTKVIVIDGDAVFQGRCDMNQEIPEAGKKRQLPGKMMRTGKKSAKAAIQEALKEVAAEEEEYDDIEKTS